MHTIQVHPIGKKTSKTTNKIQHSFLQHYKSYTQVISRLQLNLAHTDHLCAKGTSWKFTKEGWRITRLHEHLMTSLDDSTSIWHRLTTQLMWTHARSEWVISGSVQLKDSCRDMTWTKLCYNFTLIMETPTHARCTQRWRGYLYVTVPPCVPQGSPPTRKKVHDVPRWQFHAS